MIRAESVLLRVARRRAQHRVSRVPVRLFKGSVVVSSRVAVISKLACVAEPGQHVTVFGGPMVFGAVDACPLLDFNQAFAGRLVELFVDLASFKGHGSEVVVGGRHVVLFAADELVVALDSVCARPAGSAVPVHVARRVVASHLKNFLVSNSYMVRNTWLFAAVGVHHFFRTRLFVTHRVRCFARLGHRTIDVGHCQPPVSF